MGNYMRGDRVPTADFLSQLREKTGVDANWLLTGEPVQPLLPADQPTEMESVDSSAVRRIPRFEVEAAAGDGSFAQEVESVDDDGYLAVSRRWLERYVSPGARVSLIQAKGDSMAPTIFDGDLLLVQHDIDDDAVAAGGVFVITFDGAMYVKRLSYGDYGALQIISDNQRYDVRTVPAAERADRVTVHGRVFWSGGQLR